MGTNGFFYLPIVLENIRGETFACEKLQVTTRGQFLAAASSFSFTIIIIIFLKGDTDHARK